MSDTDRRTFLRRITATGAVGLGALGTAGTAAARAEPVSPHRAESLLETHADDVLSMLEADGVLDDRTALATATENTLAGVADGREGAAMLVRPTRPTELRVVTRVDDGALTVTVQPGDGHAHAVLDADDGRIGYSVEQGRYDFDALASCTCSDVNCDPPYEDHYREECCTASGCELGDCRCL
jgi:hypothetical protein